jgi:hypothetical protein
MFAPPMHEEYRPCKPPDYEIVTGVHGEPPPYHEAIKLSPGALIQSNSDNNCFSSCSASPSHQYTIQPQHHLLPSPSSGNGTESGSHTPPPPYDLNKAQGRSDLEIASTSTTLLTSTPHPHPPTPTSPIFKTNPTQFRSRSTEASPTSIQVQREPLLPNLPINLLTTSQSLTNFSMINSNSTNILFSPSQASCDPIYQGANEHP